MLSRMAVGYIYVFITKVLNKAGAIEIRGDRKKRDAFLELTGVRLKKVYQRNLFFTHLSICSVSTFYLVKYHAAVS
jgi:hypothetical protein